MPWAIEPIGFKGSDKLTQLFGVADFGVWNYKTSLQHPITLPLPDVLLHDSAAQPPLFDSLEGCKGVPVRMLKERLHTGTITKWHTGIWKDFALLLFKLVFVVVLNNVVTVVVSIRVAKLVLGDRHVCRSVANGIRVVVQSAVEFSAVVRE